MIYNVSPDTLCQWLQHDKILLVDVREKEEYEFSFIPSAYWLPLKQVCLDQLPMENRRVVFYCLLGKRSLKAAEKLVAEDPLLEVYHLTGGITAWIDMGLPIEKIT